MYDSVKRFEPTTSGRSAGSAAFAAGWPEQASATATACKKYPTGEMAVRPLPALLRCRKLNRSFSSVERRPVLPSFAAPQPQRATPHDSSDAATMRLSMNQLKAFIVED